MNDIGSTLTAEELEFCLSVLQFYAEDIEHTLQDEELSGEEREHLTAFSKNLDRIQDQFLLADNQFKSADLLVVCHLTEDHRDLLNAALDEADLFGEDRQTAQQLLRTANSILRKLKKYFRSFGIEA